MYNKFVVSGDLVETYQYERFPRKRSSRSIRRSSRKDDLSQLAPYGGLVAPSELQKAAFGARRQSSAIRAKLAFRRLVLSNLGEPHNPLLVTLTYAANQTDLGVGYSDFKSFIGRARREFGDAFKYVAVPEFQQRGAVHFHALFWGLPASVYRLERRTRLVASLWGLGYVYIKETDGDSKLAGYLSKYMAKCFTDSRLFSHRCYTASRNIRRPVEVRGSPEFSLAFQAMELSTGGCLRTSTYMTQYFGKAVYRRYKLIKQNL